MSHVARIKVRGYHLDFYGHVNNARCLELLEEARWRMVEDSASLRDWHARGLAFAIVDLKTQKAVPIEGEIREALAPAAVDAEE